MNCLKPFALLSLLFLVFGCGSSSPVVVVEEEVVAIEPIIPPSPKWSVFENSDNRAQEQSLKIVFPGSEKEIDLGPGGSRTFFSVSDDGQKTALAISNSTASYLCVYDATSGIVSTVHTGAASLVFTGDWDSNSTHFYFGEYLPEGKRMGAGAIHSFSVETQVTQKLPCSASRSVLAVLPGGTLAVRNSDSIYEIAVSDCATLQTMDARKMYHVSVSPNGNKLAYILRDLVYDRVKKAYEPDSTLYLQPLSGGDPVKVVGDKYQPRNMSWSPDGTELAFDVDAQDGTGKRAISIYSLASAGSSYLEAPASFADSRSRPVFSPNGRHIVFTATSSSGSSSVQRDLMWTSTGESFTHVVPGEPAMDFAWIGEDQLFVWSRNGKASHIIDVADGAGTAASGAGNIVWSGTGQAVFALPIR